MYDLTNLTASETVSDLVVYTNEVTGNAMSTLVILAVFFILIMRLTDRKIEVRIAIASWVCFILSLPLLVVGLVSWKLMLLFLILTAFTAIPAAMRK